MEIDHSHIVPMLIKDAGQPCSKPAATHYKNVHKDLSLIIRLINLHLVLQSNLQFRNMILPHYFVHPIIDFLP